MTLATPKTVDLFEGAAAIPAKYKELTGVTLSIANRCDSCLVYHVRRSLAAGANQGRITDWVRLAMLSSGSITIEGRALCLSALARARRGPVSCTTPNTQAQAVSSSTPFHALTARELRESLSPSGKRHTIPAQRDARCRSPVNE